MRIEFDYDVAEDGSIVGRHYIDTDDPQSMATIAKLSSGAQGIVGTGWDVISGHPSYKGMTRLHVVTEEMKRLGVKV